MASAIGAQIIAVLLATATLTDPGSGAQLPSPEGFRLTMIWIAALIAEGVVLAPFLKKAAARPSRIRTDEGAS